MSARRQRTVVTPEMEQQAHEGGYRLIPLTQGKVAKVSESAYEDLAQHTWCYMSRGYAVRKNCPGGSKTVYMHRHLLGIRGEQVADHINRDKLDNRFENLRTATPSQNSINSVRVSASGFRGVYPCGSRWEATICKGGQKTYLGSFATPQSAALAYNAAAVELHGEFARVNEYV